MEYPRPIKRTSVADATWKYKSYSLLPLTWLVTRYITRKDYNVKAYIGEKAIFSQDAESHIKAEELLRYHYHNTVNAFLHAPVDMSDMAFEYPDENPVFKYSISSSCRVKMYLYEVLIKTFSCQNTGACLSMLLEEHQNLVNSLINGRTYKLKTFIGSLKKKKAHEKRYIHVSQEDAQLREV